MTYEQVIENRLFPNQDGLASAAYKAERAGRVAELAAWHKCRMLASALAVAVEAAVKSGAEYEAVMAHVADCKSRGSVVSLLE